LVDWEKIILFKNYFLGFVTHLGKNTGHGHYVSHIKKEGKWTYYNDSKVTLTEEPPIHKGYIYFLRNKFSK